MMTARGAWAVCSFPTRPFLGNCPTKGGYLNRALAISPITSSLGDPSFLSSSLHLLEPESSHQWSLRQAARHLLDESSEGEDVGEEEGSSPGEMEPSPREERVSSGNRGSRPEGSAWVACGIRQSNIYQLVE
ncbi:UNVERIFIED_CONTAM: hypothetical protein Slati_2358200 [Sesamum latifolium]|uniref:Uncharacterized protein n=1 Tax=Sesamum latifolium TaxID=2727402 RepID=A0AAW2WEN1_9LAMI